MSTIIRRILSWGTIILVIAGIIFVTNQFFQYQSRNSIYIAIAGPMTGIDEQYGKEMVKSVQVYLDQVNRQGGINGKRLELITFDDQNDDSLAQSVAEEIVQSKAVVVLGHMNSSTSIEAGKIYKEAGIPAITASATADSVTEDNPWFFRTIPNNRSQAIFVANYAWYVLGQKTASIVYDSGAYGSSLAKPFESMFRGLGGTVKHKWSFDTEGPDLDGQLKSIFNEMAVLGPNDTGMIFMATYSEEATSLVREMRRNGLKNLVIGGDAVGDVGFAQSFKDEPEEQANPGYFSDGIYGATAMLFDTAGEETQSFLNHYKTNYNTDPGWDEATYYEAAMLAVDVIRKAHIAAQADTVELDRHAVRDELARMNSLSTAFNGLDGPLYFDEGHNAVKPTAIGIFNKQNFVSALAQLQPLNDPTRIANMDAALKNEQVLLIDGKYMYKTNVVYTGLDFIQLSELDTKNSTFAADFYLWFRYQGDDFDEHKIEFANLEDPTDPIELGEPVSQSDDGETKYRVYRIKSTFKADFDYQDYPFDSQILHIQFRHPSITRENLIFVPDVVGMRYAADQSTADRLLNANAFKAGNSWLLSLIEFYQGVAKYDSTLGNPTFLSADSEVEYSTFNAIVHIRRDVLRFATKNLIPLILLVAIAYTAFLFTPDMLSERFGLGTGSLLTTAFFHMSFVSELPQVGYVVAMEYVFYGIYTLYVIIIVTAFTSYVASKKEKDKLAGQINRLGAIVYEAIVLIGLVMLDYSYQITTLPKPQIEVAQAAAAPMAAPAPETGPVTLRFGAWRVEDTIAMNHLLAKFHEEHPDINVVYEPSNLYDDALSAQLANGTAPDLFYVRSYELSLKMYHQGYLEPLDSIPAVSENFSSESLAPWATQDGVPFGVPFIATSHGIYYNEDIFKKLNLEKPDTWDELLVTAQVLKNNGYIPFANGTADKWTAAEIIFMNLAPSFIGGYDGRMAYLSGERCFNDPYMVNAFRAVADLAPYFPEDQANLTELASETLFLKGKAAMWLGGSWNIPYFESQKPKFEWSVMAVPPPIGKKGYVTFHPDAGVGLNSASKHKKEARIFIEWISSPEFGVLMSNELPGFFSMNRTTPPLDDPHANAFLALNKDRATDVRFTWQGLMGGLPNGYNLIQDATIEILNGKLTPRQAANNLQSGLAKWYEPAQECSTK